MAGLFFKIDCNAVAPFLPCFKGLGPLPRLFFIAFFMTFLGPILTLGGQAYPL